MNKKKNNKAIHHSDFVDLRTILLKYVYHWPLFLLGIMLATGSAWAYLQLTQPVYEVSASILVKDEKKSPQEKSSLSELERSASSKNAETEIEILRSKTLIAEVVDNHQLWVKYKTKEGFNHIELYKSSPLKFRLIEKARSLKDTKVEILIIDSKTFSTKDLNGKIKAFTFNSPVASRFGTWVLSPTKYLPNYVNTVITIELDNQEDAVNAYEKFLDAHLLDKLAPTIGLFINEQVPEKGVDFLNGLISSYNNAATTEQKRVTKSTIDFIDKRLVDLTAELNSAEKDVEQYRSSQGLTDINSQAKVYLENVQSNDIKLNEVDVQLNVINGIEQYVNSSTNAGNGPATIGISDPALNSMISKLSELQLERTALLSNTPEKNPIFEPLNKQIALTKSAIKDNISSIKSSLLNSRRGLQTFNNKFESSIKNIPEQERQFVGMKRQESIKENQYVYLLQKREELELSLASSFVDARIVDKASIGEKVWPRIPLVIVIALLLGLGIPFLFVYFRNAFANKITNRKEIESAVGIQVLEEISYEDLRNDPLVLNIKFNLIGEQFRSLRTNLNYLHEQSAEIAASARLVSINKSFAGNFESDMEEEILPLGSVTLLTSSVSKEGKSFISTNLASSFATAGKKTVILEMDLRKPRVSSVFGLKDGYPGLSEFLSGNAKLSSIIQSSEYNPDLDVIGAGSIPDDPAELLGRPELAQLISELRNIYDHIIIDTPPVHLVTDALIIAPLADVSLYVIRQGYTGKDELSFIRDTYRSEKFPFFNIIFNGIKKSKYGYGYRYDQSYYGSSPDKKPLTSYARRFFSRF